MEEIEMQNSSACECQSKPSKPACGQSCGSKTAAEVILPLLPCPIHLIDNLCDAECDVVCIIGDSLKEVLDEEFDCFRKFDRAFDKVITCYKSGKLDIPVIYSPLQVELTDYHDVRTFYNAAVRGMKRVVMSGFIAPLLVVPTSTRFVCSHLCAILGALEELYIPLQLREACIGQERKIKSLSLLIDNYPNPKEIFKDISYLETGIVVARDIGMADPERMSPSNIEYYIKKISNNLPLTITVVSCPDDLLREYPLFAAVDRANSEVDRHLGRIIFIEYKPDCPVKKTLLLVGKGVTYDTGGADIKTGGSMSGMSRDKYGAATVAGFMQLIGMLAPSHVHVIAALCIVRNAIGANCYVSDEIITSRAGKRVRVKNTDAEGRMCMADALCRLKEYALEEQLVNPHFFTVATLTGHAHICAGTGYGIIIDNSVAQREGHALRMQAVGTTFGEPFEISVLREDDFEFNKGKAPGEDLVQCGYAVSVKAQRGHQIPAAFLMQASGLDEHGLCAEVPLKYSHIDIAGTATNYPDMPKSTPLIALAKTHLK